MVAQFNSLPDRRAVPEDDCAVVDAQNVHLGVAV